MSARLLQLETMGRVAGESARRFPWVLISALLAAVSAIILIDRDSSDPDLIRLLMCGQLGIPLLTASTLLGEQSGRVARIPAATRLVPLAGVILLVLYGLSLSAPFHTAVWIRFVQLNVAVHLLVAVAAFPTAGRTNAFWHFNCGIFVRFLIGVLFTCVLYGGLAVALLALKKLFGIDFDDKIYPQLWVALGFVFNTWYWLGGVPRDVDALEVATVYPRALKVFAQWILAPLVAVYLLLLTAYLVKVVITTEWPSGWIGWLVSSVGAAGLFSLLLLYPVSQSTQGRWLRRYIFVFHLLVLPAVVMLLLAIDQRIRQYGMTEKRYDLVVLAVWLGVIALVALARRRILVKTIPVSVLLLALVTSFGPWGAFAVSRSSQLHRLDGLLAPHGMLENGKLASTTAKINLDDRRQITAVIEYLVGHFGPDALASRAPQALATQLATMDTSTTRAYAKIQDQSEAVTRFLGFEPVRSGQTSEREHFDFARARTEEAFDLAGYSCGLSLVLPRANGAVFEIADREYGVQLDGEHARFLVMRDSLAVVTIGLTDLVTTLLDTARTLPTNRMPADLMRLDAAGDSLVCRLEIGWLGGSKDADKLMIDSVTGVLLVGSQKP